jgi:hypothetical protein
MTAEVASIEPQNVFLSDLLYFCEPARRFAVSEIHAGRLPMWVPYHFAGAPLIWPKFSPFLALECCTESPVVLAWAQMLAALVGGLGAHGILDDAPLLENGRQQTFLHVHNHEAGFGPREAK